MSFVRTKTIGGKPYAYLVENRWEQGRARQSVTQYLGRVFVPERTTTVIAPDVAPHGFKTAVESLLLAELLNAGFERKDNALSRESILIDTTDWSIRNKGKPAVVKLNDGFLCTYTAQQLLGFVPDDNEQQTGYALARRLVEAGLAVPRETFVKLFEKVTPKEAP